MKEIIESIFEQFEVQGRFARGQRWGSGHLNDTYAISCDSDKTAFRYILQRINDDIFKDPVSLMENITRVTEHIRKKLIEMDVGDIDRRVLTVVPAKNGQNWFCDADGHFWRTYLFISDAATYDVVESNERAYEAAKSFGEFGRQLADLPGPTLHETIPNFHDGPLRFKALEQAVEADSHNRAGSVKKEIETVFAQADVFNVVPQLIEDNKIPIRPAHNDTKVNNVMIDDRTGKGICVIDLDTVMPGICLYDFGDIIRTMASASAEDERDLSKVVLHMGRFESLAKGYLTATRTFLSDVEKEYLVFGGALITLIIGTRFLTDYLCGDKYYRISRAGHNLDRCRTQLRLYDLIMNDKDKLDRLIEKAGEQI